MLLSLEGLSVGDALGERFFGTPSDAVRRIDARELPPGPWRYTDDTEMALSVVDVLASRGEVAEDLLAASFARRYDLDRGYGSGAHRLLQSYRQGVSWREGAPALFGGTGSYGNGAAMRVAPLGGYFADDLARVAREAERSAVVTHAHPEGIAGAVAVALAAALAYRQGELGAFAPADFFDAVLDGTPVGATREGIAEAARLDPATPIGDAARLLGSGQDVSAQDTVPFVLWSAAHALADFEEAFWRTVAGLGDRDTTCAMVGGIVALSSRSIPRRWLAEREALPLTTDPTLVVL